MKFIHVIEVVKVNIKIEKYGCTAYMPCFPSYKFIEAIESGGGEGWADI